MGGKTDELFEAVGPGSAGGAGFFTSATAFSKGGDFTGNQLGVKGICQGPFGAANEPGVSGLPFTAEISREATLPSFSGRLRASDNLRLVATSWESSSWIAQPLLL
jgi:hypothetical protein